MLKLGQKEIEMEFNYEYEKQGILLRHLLSKNAWS